MLKMGHLSIFSLVLCLSGIWSTAAEINSPLRICPENPRYFSGADGHAIFLTGSHVWYNLVDMGPTDPPQKFGYTAYLNWMKNYNHNFMRMWAWELIAWNTQNNGPHRNEHTFFHVQPLPWQRTGPGEALDGKPKFDLTKFNPEYFERLRERVRQAQDEGIYVSVMLFEGWGMQFVDDALKYHPFNRENNINGVHGDQNGDGKGLEIHELVIPEITEIQEEYVKKVIDTINEFDNVLYEISNENHPESTEWQYHMIKFIHDFEKDKPKQHPVGMTFQYKGGSNQTLFDSPADWISPNHEDGYRDNPPAADGKKVILNDTDHLWGIGGNRAWVWKSVCRGMNPIFMDPYDGVVLGKKFDPQWESIRQNLGYARQILERLNVTDMVPHDDLVSSGYCLAAPGSKYLVYLPQGSEVNIDLTGHEGRFRVRWLNPENGERQRGEAISGGKKATLQNPFGEGDAILVLRVQQ
jgi:hypothetical protein